jgi:hypothetical protein
MVSLMPLFSQVPEMEGLFKGLDAVDWYWEKVKQRRPCIVVAAHEPVTANGVESFGLTVDVLI